MQHGEIDGAHFSRDTLEFIRLLEKHGVRYLLIGGEAVIFYGHIRLTGDVDFFYEREPQNLAKLYSVLSDFWSGSIPGIPDPRDLPAEGEILQFGRPPNRIDLLNRIDGVAFAEAWESRVLVNLRSGEDTLKVPVIGLAALIKNKRASGRSKDQDDLQYLTRL